MSSHFVRMCERVPSMSPPKWLTNAIHYEVLTGSVAYGVSSDSSDLDIYGWAIPPKEIIFPHLRGEIQGFSKGGPRFEQYQKHHVVDPDARAGKGREYDFQIFSIVKFFRLCADNNPNMIDCLFTPREYILHSTQVGEMVRENRHLFLSRLCWPKFKGYAYSQMHKMTNKRPEGKRKESVGKYGYDVKYAYHIIRLLDEVEQILTEGDLDLQRAREVMKAVRRGDWSEQKVIDHFSQKERQLEDAWSACTLPDRPDEHRLQSLLLKCLKYQYESLDTVVAQPDRAKTALQQIVDIAQEALQN